MAFRSVTHGLVALVLAAIPAVTNALEFDGRVYQFVQHEGISWADANDAANNMTLGGLPGHLATISTDAENSAINQLVTTEGAPSASKDEVWIGGFEDAGAWKWVNNGIISPDDENWLPGEPSDDPGGEETFLTFGRGGSDQWGSQDKGTTVFGYVVEFGDNQFELAGIDCTADDPNAPNDPGCILGQVNGTKITIPIPAAELDAGDTYTVNTELIHDDPLRCGVAPLPVNDDVTLGKHLCGTPDILVAKVTTDDFQINEGVVQILVDDDVLPQQYPCVPVSDPTEAGVVGYQNSVHALEKDHASGIQYFGDDGNTVFESTHECGSYRGTGTGRTYYIAGLRAHFGPTGWSEARFLGFLKYKLFYLSLAVNNACKATSKGACSNMKNQVKTITGDLNKKNYREAAAHTDNFRKLVESTTFQTFPNENNEGEVLSRILNFGFTLAKFQPFLP